MIYCVRISLPKTIQKKSYKLSQNWKVIFVRQGHICLLVMHEFYQHCFMKIPSTEICFMIAALGT